MDPYPKTLAQLAEELQEVEVVSVVAEDVLAVVSTSGHVIPPAGPLEAQCACHAFMEPGEDHLVKAHLSK